MLFVNFEKWRYEQMTPPEFKRGFRGYDSDAVDQAWAESEREISEINAANKELRIQINSLKEQKSELESRLKYYEKIEKDLRDALVNSQRIANQLKDDASKQAEDIIQAARNESENILSEATRLKESKEIETDTLLSEKRKEIVELEKQIQGLNDQKAQLETVISQAKQYLAMIKGLFSEAS